MTIYAQNVFSCGDGKIIDNSGYSKIISGSERFGKCCVTVTLHNPIRNLYKVDIFASKFQETIRYSVSYFYDFTFQ